MGSSSLNSPAFVVTFSFFLLSHLALHFAEEGLPGCSPFRCGNLDFTYPFSNKTHLECGLSTIRCGRDIPMIDSEGGTLYEVKSINETDNTIVIHDVQLLETLRRGNCNGIYNFSTSIFPTLSFKVKTPNLTLFKCDKYLTRCAELLSAGFHEFLHCQDSILFYQSNSEQSQTYAPTPPPAPDGCELFYFPALPPSARSGTPLLSSLKEGFSLEWSSPPECNNCEATCQRDHNGALKKCAVLEQYFVAGREKKLAPILGIVFGTTGGIFLLCLIFFYCRGRHNGRLFGIAKRKNPSSTSLSGNTISNLFSKLNLQKGGSTYFGAHIFSHDELVKATNNFDSSRELGDGGFGTVYYGKLRDGRVVAVKRLYENSFKRVEQFMNEVEILTQLRHRNLVTLYGCTSRHSRELLLVYEYIPNGTVADHLHGDREEPGSLSWPIRMSIAIETANALSYLHSSDVIHRDVKTNNILLDNNFRVKVADFGLSRLFPLDVTHISTAPQGTPGYVDPEYHQCYKLTNKSDVYSFGVVLIELISSMPAVDINRHRHEINLANFAINKIQNGALHELVDPCIGFESDHAVRMMTTLVAELAFRCLQPDRDMRPTMDEVLEVLREIESENNKEEKAEVVAIMADDVWPSPPFSPA